MKNYTLHVSGTHCASCKIVIEDILKEQSFVHDARVDLVNKTLSIETNSEILPEKLVSLVTGVIQPHGYTASLEKILPTKKSYGDIGIAFLIGISFLILFFFLQKSGVLTMGIGGQVTPLTSFIIGLIASVSSCLAIVGGLVLSLSAKISQDNTSDTKTFILFHAGRLVSFAILGGLLGIIGGVIGINFVFSGILGLLASIVMIVLGLNLIGVFEKNKITLSGRIFNSLRGIEHKTLTPLIVGFATFFLPCGFTQTMQLSALSSGSFISGFMIMVSFALGTLPMLALLSFGSASFARSNYASLFFRSAGVVVIGLGLFALLSGLAGLGIINPLFTL